MKNKNIHHEEVPQSDSDEKYELREPVVPERISPFSIKSKGAPWLLGIFTILVVLYGIIIVYPTVKTGNGTWNEIVHEFVCRVSPSVPVFFIFILGIDLMRGIAYRGWVYALKWIKRKIEASARRKIKRWEEWNRRRLEAMAKGVEFDEPHPE